jgi:hypothetical protein
MIWFWCVPAWALPLPPTEVLRMVRAAILLAYCALKRPSLTADAN